MGRGLQGHTFIEQAPEPGRAVAISYFIIRNHRPLQSPPPSSHCQYRIHPCYTTMDSTKQGSKE